jgi:hypothetical protein
MQATTDRPKAVIAVPRSRGALSGLLLIVLGLWGALLPFVGQYAHFGFAPDATWHWTAARFWLQLLPGAATFLAGLLILLAGNRVVGMIGGLLAIAAGLWFVAGPILADLHRAGYVGAPLGGNNRQHFEWLASFFGLGAVIAMLGALVVGRLSVVGVRDVETWEKRHADRGAADENSETSSAAIYPERTIAAEGETVPVESRTREVPVRLTNIRPSRDDNYPADQDLSGGTRRDFAPGARPVDESRTED